VSGAPSGAPAGAVAERLYYDSAELEFEAEVTDIRLASESKAEDGTPVRLWQMALDRTAFYPEGGGQPWDVGTLTATAPSGATLEVAVEEVREDEAGEVWHVVRKPLMAGTRVRGKVDAARRMDHAQQHSGQHLLSAVFLREMGARTVSFRLSPLKSGWDSSTIDLALAEGMEKLSEGDLALVEDVVAREVYADRAMRPRWVAREVAEAMLARGELRKLPERVGPMRIVEMEGVELNACGGTHVPGTGAIGGLLLRKVEKVKQGWRVEFVCGLRAVRAARRDYALLGGVARMLSVGAVDVPGRVERLLGDVKAAAKELKSLRKA
jgi:alanyl-tRNA synthetase